MPLLNQTFEPDSIPTMSLDVADQARIREAKTDDLLKESAEHKANIAETIALGGGGKERGGAPVINWDVAVEALKKKDKDKYETITANDIKNDALVSRAFVEVINKELGSRAEAAGLKNARDSLTPDPRGFEPSGASLNPSVIRNTSIMEAMAARESDEFQKEWKERDRYRKGDEEVFENARASEFLAAVTSTSNGITVDDPRDESSVVMYRDKMRNIGPRLPRYSVINGTDSYSYIRELGFGNTGTQESNVVAGVAEGGTFPQQEVATTTIKQVVHKQAAYLSVTDELMADVQAARTLVTNRLTRNIQERIENQIVNGDGTGQNWDGIWNTSDAQDLAKSAAGDGTDDDPRVVTNPSLHVFIKAQEILSTNAETFPNWIAMNAGAISTIMQLRDNDGRYLWSNVVGGAPTMIMGVPVVWSNHIPNHSAMVIQVADFGFLEKMGMTMVWGFTGDDFIKGQQSVKVECRGNTLVFRPKSLVKVTGLNVAD